MSSARHTLYAWLYVTMTRLIYVLSNVPAGSDELTYRRTIATQLIAELTAGNHVAFDATQHLAHDIATWVADARSKPTDYNAVASQLHSAVSAPWPAGSPDHPDFGELDGSFR